MFRSRNMLNRWRGRKTSQIGTLLFEILWIYLWETRLTLYIIEYSSPLRHAEEEKTWPTFLAYENVINDSPSRKALGLVARNQNFKSEQYKSLRRAHSLDECNILINDILFLLEITNGCLTEYRPLTLDQTKLLKKFCFSDFKPHL